jgi:hypothetical protein
LFFFADQDLTLLLLSLRQEIINWIKDNSGDYHLDHCLSLVTAKAAGAKDKAFMTDGKKAVAAIYDDRLNR